MENRVIKFRAWDTVMKWYVPDFDNWIDFHGNYYSKPDIGFDTPHIEIVKQYHYEIEQFTGLHDRDGKEVYEGDRLSAGGGSLVYEVVFQDGGFCFKNELSSGPDRLSKDRVARLSIIGHIHETN